MKGWEGEGRGRRGEKYFVKYPNSQTKRGEGLPINPSLPSLSHQNLTHKHTLNQSSSSSLNHDSAAVGENLLPQPRTTTSPAFPSAAVGGSPLFTDATVAVKNITSSVLPRDRFHFLLFPFAHVEEPQSFEDEEPRLFPLCASKNPNRLTTKNPGAVLHCRALFSTKDPHSGDVPRVNGQLAVSRAFGDKSLKSHLRSDPDVQHTDIDADIDILILASDGLWKVK